MDKVKLSVSVLLLAAAMVAFYYYEDQSKLYRVIGLLAVAGVSVAIAMTTELGRFAWAFVGEARLEVRKVVWPTQRETLQTTLVVVLMVMLVAVFLWLLDMLLGSIVQQFVGQGG